MPYRFRHDDRSVGDGVRRIAAEQIDDAIVEIDDADLDVHATVHQVRKRCKKLRGVARLVRPSFPAYAAENAAFRDAARALSFLRDTEALIETYDKLVEAYAGRIDRAALGSVRHRLTLRKKAAARREDIGDRLAAFRDEMAAARGRVDGWRLEADGFDAVAGGLGRTYKRGRKAMAAARKRPTPEALHEWRKRVKYHWYHARIMRPIWPGPMRAHRDAADALGDLLGDHHDLAVFRGTVAADPDAFGGPADIELLFGLIEHRQAALEAEAARLGPRLLAEPRKALTRRWGAYWQAWRREPSPRGVARAA